METAIEITISGLIISNALFLAAFGLAEKRWKKKARRAASLLRTIRCDGYTPDGTGTIAIESRIRELESEWRNE